jgi:hypothetical protein
VRHATILVIEHLAVGHDGGVQPDSKNLSRLHRVANPRDVWTSESGDFTPWLAENLDVLADALGMTFTLVGTEVPVGEFRLDIHAVDDEGRAVIIENQLERTDHSHLGQCLVYASGLEASTVIWVAPAFRDDFRRAFDWLNERTDLGVSFFGVEISVVQIGGHGPQAPVFDVVARPNDWQKTVKGGAGMTQLAGSAISPLNAKRQEFFAEVFAEVVAQRPAIRQPARSRSNWVSFASGPFGYWAISFTSDGQLRVEAYLDTQDKVVNKRLFDQFHDERNAWEDAVGQPLRWERLDEKRASRIAAYHDVDLDDAGARATVKNWAADAVIRMVGALNEQLRLNAKLLRAAATEFADTTVAAAHDSGDDGLAAEHRLQ